MIVSPPYVPKAIDKWKEDLQNPDIIAERDDDNRITLPVREFLRVSRSEKSKELRMLTEKTFGVSKKEGLAMLKALRIHSPFDAISANVASPLPLSNASPPSRRCVSSREAPIQENPRLERLGACLRFGASSSMPKRADIICIGTCCTTVVSGPRNEAAKPCICFLRLQGNFSLV